MQSPREGESSSQGDDCQAKQGSSVSPGGRETRSTARTSRKDGFNSERAAGRRLSNAGFSNRGDFRGASADRQAYSDREDLMSEGANHFVDKHLGGQGAKYLEEETEAEVGGQQFRGHGAFGVTSKLKSGGDRGGKSDSGGGN